MLNKLPKATQKQLVHIVLEATKKTASPAREQRSVAKESHSHSNRKDESHEKNRHRRSTH